MTPRILPEAAPSARASAVLWHLPVSAYVTPLTATSTTQRGGRQVLPRLRPQPAPTARGIGPTTRSPARNAARGIARRWRGRQPPRGIGAVNAINHEVLIGLVTKAMITDEGAAPAALAAPGQYVVAAVVNQQWRKGRQRAANENSSKQNRYCRRHREPARSRPRDRYARVWRRRELVGAPNLAEINVRSRHRHVLAGEVRYRRPTRYLRSDSVPRSTDCCAWCALQRRQPDRGGKIATEPSGR